jgi:hypothetical protein
MLVEVHHTSVGKLILKFLKNTINKTTFKVRKTLKFWIRMVLAEDERSSEPKLSPALLIE